MFILIVFLLTFKLKLLIYISIFVKFLNQKKKKKLEKK